MPNSTGSGSVFSDTEPVSDMNGTYGAITPSGSLPTQAGTYYWVASYSGEPNVYNPVTTQPYVEPETVSPTTTVSAASVAVGSAINDTAMVSTDANATGTVTFNLYDNPTASGTPLFTDSEPVSGGTATSASYTTTATGTDYWVATYNYYDSDNNSLFVTSDDASEPVNIDAINTSQTPASARVGGSIADKATVTGLVSASSSDTVTFNLYSSATEQDSSTLLFTDTETVSLSGSTATALSAGYTSTATGTDYWVATFNGDSNNSLVSSVATAEPVSVTPTTPGINTQQQPGTATVGASIADKATVTGLVSASSSDTVTFNLYSSATEQDSSTLLFTDTETVSLSGSTATALSAGYTSTATGTDYWVATFNGDSNNSLVSSVATAEPVSVTPTTPGINTQQQPGTATVGASIADKATVTGLVSASSSDTVTFNLYSSATEQDSSTLLFTDTETVSLSGSTATALSAGYTSTATGTDYWVATFNGDSNNSLVSSVATAEPVSVTPTTPGINTQQQPGTATVGASIADKATVTGLVSASSSDTVTFNLYSSATEQDSSTLLFTDTETVSLSGSTATALSAGYTSTATGTDYWVATFNGDSNNSLVSSVATAEPVSVTPTTPGINTQQQPGTATVGASIADKATVTGLVSASSSDTVTFNLYSSATEQDSSTLLFTDTETVSLSGSMATALSAGYTSTATGTDYWVATFNGDSNNSLVSSVATAEPVSVTPTTPGINTQQQPGTATVGASIADKATVTGLVSASSSDTVTFNLYSSATEQDSSTLLFTDTEALSSTATALSAGYTSTATGTDYWVATFNGDSNNSLVSSVATAEPVNVTPTTPGINTQQQPGTATVGASSADKATVTGLVSASSSDTVTFNLYSSAATQNSSTLLFSDTEALSSSGTALSAGYTTTATGTDYWVATFNGDSNNSLVSSVATAEPVSVTPTTPGINTQQQPGTATVGASIADKATVTGLVSASSGDTVTFNLYSSATTQNSSTLLFSDTEALSSSGTALSAGYTTTATGTDYWVATFNGDSNNSKVTSASTAEPVSVTPTTPGINTQQQPGTATVGASIADKATVTGLVSASSGDTVTFNLYSSATTQNSSTLLFSDTEALSSSGTALSAGYTTTATGTDYWVATFNGDSNNSKVTSASTAEPVSVTPTTPGINTQQQPGTATVGASIADKATVTGLVSASSGDTVTFNLYSSATTQNSSTLLFSDTEALSSSGTALSAGYTTTATGTDYWVATFNGDSNNSKVTSASTAEPVSVTPTTPGINTQQQPGTATVGASIADKATVTGLVNASSSDTVTFNLYSSAATQNSSTLLFSDTEALSSSGTALSAGYTTTATGTDYWVATFNGDSNNSKVTSASTAEPVSVTPTTPGINTQQQPGTATVGASIADKATVTGLVNASSSDTVTFNLYSSAATQNSSTLLFSDTEALSSSGTALSAGYTTTATGTDYWVATFNGDSNNSKVTSASTAEPVSVTPTTPGINTQQQPGTATVGASIADKATVTGLVSASSGDTVTFNLYSSATTQNSSTLLYSNTQTVSLSGGTATATSAGYTSTATGTDYWVATFNGDSNNSKVTSASTAEPVSVTPATPGINTQQQPATATVGASIADKATVTGLVSASSSDTVTFNLYSSATTQNSSTLLYTNTQTVSISGSTATATSAGYTATAIGTDYWVATFNGDSNNAAVASGATSEPVTVGTPKVIVTKTADCAEIAPCGTAGYTVTITNTGSATATGVTLSDPLPAGKGNDIVWTIDTTKDNPSDFTITGSKGSQQLVLSSTFLGTASGDGDDSLAAGASISVHITAPTCADDAVSTCTVQSSIPCSFNGNTIPGGDYLWFNCAVNCSNVSTSVPTSVCFTGQTISFTCGSQSYNVPVPDGCVTFSPNCSTAASSYNSGENCWVTNCPEGLSGSEFLCGVPFQIPAGGFSGGITNVTWSGTCSADANVGVNLKWSASCYSNFSTNCSVLGVKPCDSGGNGDQCGTPEWYRCYQTTTCGSNGNGSCTSQCTVTPSCECGGTGTLTNTATVGATGQSPVSSGATITITTCIKPQVTVTKTADSPTVTAGQTAGYTVTVTNTSSTTAASSVTLNDPLPAGLGKDISWSIASWSGATTDPFVITGSKGSQTLTLVTNPGTLAAGQSISVHITGLTYANDVTSTCTSQCSIPNNFNGTSIPGGDFIWFNCAVNCSGQPTNVPTTICLTGQTISFTCGGTSYNVPVPNGCVTLSPSCATTTSTFNGQTNCWITNCGEGLPGNEFLCGVPFQVPAGGFCGGIQNVSWSGSCSDSAGVGVNLQWGAACYSIFTANCSAINVKPCDSNSASQYKDSDHCGSPENFTCYVTGGACGGGGSNYTGSYSGTCGVTPSTGCGNLNTLTNVATVGAMCQPNVCAAATITLEAPVTISGTKYLDVTGNGFSCDDTGLGGVTIDLYQGSLSSTPLTTTTAANGTYSFTGLAPGTYYVEEGATPGTSTYIQTGGGPNGTAGSTYYTINTLSGGTYGGNNFDDYLVPANCTPSYSYTVTACNGTPTSFSSLGGNTAQGDTVKVSFTNTMSTSETFTLVSYIAPSNSWNAATAYEQQIYQEQSVTLAAGGSGSLTVQIPNCYYQIDFDCGPAINVLVPQTYNGCAYGPDNANITYHAEDRYIDSDNGGTQACPTKGVSCGDFGTTSLWSCSNGETLLKDLNGGSTSTQAAQWLATSFPNLYGAGCGTHSLVCSNGTYFTNSQLESAYANFSSTNGDRQALSAALSVYCTSIDLAGTSATNYAKSPVGLNTSGWGSGMDAYSVGADGSAFGLANNTTLTVMQLLGALNANTRAGASVSSGANTVFSGINNSGNVVSQLAAGSSSLVGVGVGELLGWSQLQAGPLDVAVDLPQGPHEAAEMAAIKAAIASLNVQVAPLGVTLVEVSGLKAVSAPIHISMASTSPAGGVGQGVLGAFAPDGDITLVSGWNWYFGSASSKISPKQYDFQTVVTHELGHALGLGESSDPASAMDLYLSQGQTRRNLATNDLNAIRAELQASPAPVVSTPVAQCSVGSCGLGVAGSVSGAGGGSDATSSVISSPAITTAANIKSATTIAAHDAFFAAVGSATTR